MWRRRRGLRQLAGELADARAEHAELRRRVEAFELIAAAAGAGRPPEPIPPSLVTAARELRAADVPVRIDVAGTDVVAVVGGGGDPREWWAAIWRLAGPGEAHP